MKINEIRDRIAEIVTQITFTYNGKNCGVDPMSSTEFDMWCGDDFVTVGSIEEVMNIKHEMIIKQQTTPAKDLVVSLLQILLITSKSLRCNLIRSPNSEN